MIRQKMLLLSFTARAGFLMEVIEFSCWGLPPNDKYK